MFSDISAAATSLSLMFFSTDRKSTRLNSSHLVISYAVFCLKKKHLRYAGDHFGDLRPHCLLRLGVSLVVGVGVVFPYPVLLDDGVALTAVAHARHVDSQAAT